MVYFGMTGVHSLLLVTRLMVREIYANGGAAINKQYCVKKSITVIMRD